MGVAKLILPKWMYYRQYLPANRNWRRNSMLALLQIFTLSNVIWVGMGRWKWAPPMKGKQVLKSEAEYTRPIPIL